MGDGTKHRASTAARRSRDRGTPARDGLPQETTRQETALAWLRKWVEKNTLPPNREYLLGLIKQAKP